MNPTEDIHLAESLLKCHDNPLLFVQIAYPWGEPGPLAQFSGPDKWQREMLEDIGQKVKDRAFDGRNAVSVLRYATASGHGIGKSTIVAWITNWIMCTRHDCRGTVTANTFQQLQSKTWAAICHWTKLCVASKWFEVGSEVIYRKGAKERWFVAAQTCKEENSEAFAGQHAAGSTSFYIFDEASAIPDKIWEVAEGGLTDGEPMIFAFGNPTQSQGKFYRVCFGSERNRWVTRAIDSRESSLTNKKQIQEWIDDYGEDSDFVRVRVRGLPPSASDLQFIDSRRVYDAQRREALFLPDDAIVVGVDIARGGGDNNVFWFRRGHDARSIPPIVIPGEESRDSMRIVTKLLDVMETEYDGVKPAMAFLDGTGIGGPIADRCRQMGYANVVEIQFGWKSPDHHYLNMRAYMWAQLKDWLQRGAIPTDSRLEVDLTTPGYKHDKADRVVLEAKEDMKKRGADSPDYADALALTFAQPVGPRRRPSKVEHVSYEPGAMSLGWMA